MNYLINQNISKKTNKNFLKASLKIRSKIKKFINKSSFIYKNSGKVKIMYVDDTVQKEKSFKVRGALSEIIFNEKKIKKKNTIVLASTGNFAFAMASICKQKKINCMVYVTHNIDKKKLHGLKKFGAKIFFSKNYESAKKTARNFARDKNYFFSDGCNKSIFLGNASLMIETLEQLKKKDKNFNKKKILAILPVGNGSLAASSSIILNNILLNIEIACIEPFNFRKSQKILNNKIKINFENTIADGAAIRKLPQESRKIVFQNCKYIFSSKESEIKSSMKYIYKNFNIMSEGAGALANTVVLFNPKFVNNYDYVIVPICGGNIDKNKFLGYIDL